MNGIKLTLLNLAAGRDRSRMHSLDKNPGTETFDQGQKKLALPILILTVLAAVLAEGASWDVVPVLLAIGAIYLLIVIGGARLVRALGMRFLDRHN
jgi:protein-S-isoprenylcysteine O-methyltransferase Ste14